MYENTALLTLLGLIIGALMWVAALGPTWWLLNRADRRRDAARSVTRARIRRFVR
jgi:hypothetical protein